MFRCSVARTYMCCFSALIAALFSFSVCVCARNTHHTIQQSKPNMQVYNRAIANAHGRVDIVNVSSLAVCMWVSLSLSVCACTLVHFHGRYIWLYALRIHTQTESHWHAYKHILNQTRTGCDSECVHVCIFSCYRLKNYGAKTNRSLFARLFVRRTLYRLNSTQILSFKMVTLIRCIFNI